jgi:mannose-6-phosphate isomerase-like protein (cupin superfamily)
VSETKHKDADIRGVLVHVGDGEAITRRDRRDVILLTERIDISMTWSRYAPGERGPDPHVHREHTDSFYVLDGELKFAVGPEGEPIRIPAGGFLAVPPKVVHSFANETSMEARFLNFHTPDGGFAAYMRGRRDGLDVAFDSFDPPRDGGRPAAEAILAGPDGGERLLTGNRVVYLKGVLPDLCFTEWALDGPFDGPEVHHHDHQVDSFYVIEGELEMTIGGALHMAGPGTLASVPRGVRHTFAHPNPGKAQVLNVHAPDRGFADFLRRLAD